MHFTVSIYFLKLITIEFYVTITIDNLFKSFYIRWYTIIFI